MYSNDQKDDGSPKFQTRTGDAQGASIERKMLDAVGGMNTIRTQLMIAPDGSETLLKTGGGLARFINEPVKPEEPEPAVPKRTFVFSRVAGMASATIANRNNSSLKVVKRGMQVNQDVSYFVHSYKTDTKVKWGDVYRLDAHTPKLNGKSTTPDSVAYIGPTSEWPQPATTPSLPYRFQIPSTTTLSAGRTGIFLGTTECQERVDYFDVYLPKVSQVKADGSIIDTVSITGGPAWAADMATGVRCDKNGKYSFAWMVGGINDPSITSSYAEVTTGINAAPSITKHETNTVQNTGFSLSLSTTKSDPVHSERVVGQYYAAMRRRLVYPPPWDFNVYGWRAWAIEIFYPNETFDAFASSIKRTISRTLSGALQLQQHYKDSPYLLDVSGRCDGVESVVDEMGYVPPEKMYDKFYRNDSGSELRISRNSTSTIVAKFPAPICGVREVYSAELVNSTTLSLNGLKKITSIWWNYDAYPMPIIAPAGDYWVNNEYDYNGTSRAIVEAGIAQQNEQAKETDEMLKYYGPPDIPGVFCHVEYEPDRAPTRTDSYVLTVKAVDFVFSDPENGVAVYMESLLTATFYYSKSGGFPNIYELPDVWNKVTSELKIDFVVKHQHGEFVHTHLDKPTHIPEFAWGFFSNPGDEDQENIFSGVHIPPLTTPAFNPIYMNQGKCPWIGYTTHEEEAGIDGKEPATPEFYIDMKLAPKPTGTTEIGNSYGPALYADVTTFTAHQLAALVRNYLAVNAPPEYWSNHLFPSPVKIRFSYGIPNPWVDAIGAPFSENDHVTISRI